jgi:hypothetical protein
MAETVYSQQVGQKSQTPPTNENHQSLTPPDKKRKSGEGISVN